MTSNKIALRSARAALALLLLAPLASAQLIPPDELAGGQAVSPPILRPSTPYNATVASDGSEFLAVWNAYKYGSAAVFAVRTTPEGKLIEQQHPIAPWWEAPVALVWNGSDHALFLRSESQANRIVTILRDGTAVERKSIDFLQLVGAAWNGSRYAVVLFSPARTAHQLRYYDRDFNPLESITFGEAGGQSRRVSVTAGDRKFLITWVDSRGVGAGYVTRLFFQLFDERGNALTALREFALTNAAATLEAAAVSWNGSSFVAIWAEPSRVGGRVISSSGEVERSFEIATTPGLSSPSISWDGRVHLAVWEKQPVQPMPSAPPVYEAAVLSSTGDVLDRFPVPAGAAVVEGPAIAANGREFLVLAAGRAVGIRPVAAERTLDYGPYSYSYPPQASPVITAGSSQLVTAWSEGDEAVYASRVSSTGSRIGDVIHLGSGLGSHPIAAASAGDIHLIAWRPRLSSMTHLALLNDSGEAREIIGVPAERSSNVIAAASGSSFALFWMTPRDSFLSPGTLMMSWISKQGGLASHVVGRAPFNVTLLAAAWTGSDYGVLWRRQLSDPCQFPACPPPPSEDHLTRITREGVIISDVIVPTRYVIASLVDEAGAVRVSRVETGTTQIDVERIGFDGSTAPSVRSTTTNNILYDGALVGTDTGYALTGNFQEPVGWNWRAVTIQLDATGRILQSVVRDPLIRGTTWAFGSLWTTFTAVWRPLPESHGFGVQRAYYRATTPRVRAVRR